MFIQKLVFNYFSKFIGTNPKKRCISLYGLTDRKFYNLKILFTNCYSLKYFSLNIFLSCWDFLGQIVVCLLYVQF